ncbi:MAG: BrnA antitoxin family protein [Candidatus Dormibacteraceae bacterium]
MTKRARKAPAESSGQRPIPRFVAEDDERAFWATADSTEYVDWRQGKRVRLPALKPSTATISLRLPEGLLEELKILANERDVPYQSLLKIFLAERLQQERRRRRSA